MPPPDPEHVSDVLADAWAMGDSAAAELHGLSRRTVLRYRAKLEAEEEAGGELSQLVAQKIEPRRHDWSETRQAFLRAAIAKLHTLIDLATGADIPAICGAIKIVGELELTGAALAPAPHPRPRALPAAPARPALPAGDTGQPG